MTDIMITQGRNMMCVCGKKQTNKETSALVCHTDHVTTWHSQRLILSCQTLLPRHKESVGADIIDRYAS